MDTVLLQKEVDKSVLYQGMSIPKVYQKLFMDKLGVPLIYMPDLDWRNHPELLDDLMPWSRRVKDECSQK